MRTILWLVLLPATVCAQQAEALAPWKSNRHPTDAPKRHAEVITAGRAEYRVVQGGTMDGRNCRSPLGVWTPFVQTWESNRSVRMEHVGPIDIVNPWLSNGRNDFRSVSAIVTRALAPGMTDQEKAISLWWQQIQHRFHFQGDNRELASPVKVLNVYGHNACGNDSICLAGLGAESAENIVSSGNGLAAEEGQGGVIEWTIRAPYVVVGGKLDVDGTGARFELSWDRKSWEPVGTDLDPLFPPVGTARYVYHLRCRLAGPARLRGLRIVNDLQMAPLALPEMGIGENQFTYSDESPAADFAAQRRVRMTREWVERSATRAPLAPAAAIRPQHQGEAAGTDVVFEWEPAIDQDGDKIADYQLELSPREDMKWPLSMSFAKLISRTSDAGSARFTLKAPGGRRNYRIASMHCPCCSRCLEPMP